MRQLKAFVAAASMAASVALAQGPTGPEFKVSGELIGEHLWPSVAARGTGTFLATWMHLPNRMFDPRVFARAFDGAGLPLGPELRVSADEGHQLAPSVAAAASGFVLVWEDHRDLPAVLGRRFDAAGTALGAEFTVSGGGQTFDEAPRIASAADGSFVVVWTNVTGDDGGGYGVFGRRFSAAAQPLGPPFQVNSYTTGNQGSLTRPPALAIAADGSFAVVWESRVLEGGGSGIVGQLFDGSGVRRGAEFLVDASTATARVIPDVAFGADGGLRVVWSAADGAQILARRFDGDGTPMGDPDRVDASSGTSHRAPWIVPVAAGRHLVVWERLLTGPGFPSLRGRRLDAAGVPVGPEFPVGSRTVGPHTVGPSLPPRSVAAADGAGGLMVAWSTVVDLSSQHEDVVARRFMALAPAVSDIDPTGNGVLEPGESVVFAPAWHNYDDAPAAGLAATASDFSGPGGALYTVVDGNADFGTVAPDTTRSCTAGGDCYGLALAAPATRPVQHWDAVLQDELSTGQQQAWSVHVGASFVDVSGASPAYRFVETVLHRGVSAGCGGARFCPADATTREQMSALVLAAAEGAGYRPGLGSGQSLFTDVPFSHPFYSWIHELVRRGVAGGCGGGRFCPGSPVTRAETAVFVLRTLDPALVPPACGTPAFNDVPPSNPFCPWVEELARRGVVAGCGGGRFCPDEPTTREQMAVILSTAFGLTLYGP